MLNDDSDITRAVEAAPASIAAVLDRLVLLAMLAILAAILTAAMVMQYAFGEIPCPLCLLQRYAMLGCCFGIIVQLRSGASERGTGLGLIFAILLLVIAVRQTLLDIVARPGHAYIGSAVLGLHLPVWSVLIAVALLFGFALRLALFGGVRAALVPEPQPARARRSHGWRAGSPSMSLSSARSILFPWSRNAAWTNATPSATGCCSDAIGADRWRRSWAPIMGADRCAACAGATSALPKQNIPGRVRGDVDDNRSESS